MSEASLAYRVWAAFTDSEVGSTGQIAARDRSENSLWRRCWAAFTGLSLPPGARPHATLQSPVSHAAGESARPTASPHGHGVPFTGWFALPKPAALTASSSGRVITRKASPDGRIECLVRRVSGTPVLYVLEVVLRDVTSLPAVVMVRTREAEQAHLLVAVASTVLGPPASQVAFQDFDPEQIWEISAAEPVTEAGTWPVDTIAVSVRAAINEATRNAWRQVRGIIADVELRQAIDQALQ